MRKTEIKIERPNGKIEIVDVTDKFSQGITDQMFEQIKKGTQAAGKGLCLSYTVTDVDTRTAAEKDYDSMVGKALTELYNAQNASYSDPARIIKAKSALDAAKSAWATKHPTAAGKIVADKEKKAAEKKERIQNSAGYKAAIEGRD